MKLKKLFPFLFAVAALSMMTACGNAQTDNTTSAAVQTTEETKAITDDTSMIFPAFEGKDLDGNDADSSLITDHAVTVVNYWFTTCNPCVEELEELEALSHELAEKDGVLIGINAFTIGGDTQEIEDAKEVLAKKGVTYQNIYFDYDSDAGNFSEQIFAYPTTYVLDQNGTIIGEPIVGSINSNGQKEKLYKLIDEALEAEGK